MDIYTLRSSCKITIFYVKMLISYFIKSNYKITLIYVEIKCLDAILPIEKPYKNLLTNKEVI